MLSESRWSIWLIFECINASNHGPGSQIGVAVLTNSFYAPMVIRKMDEKICSICGEPFFQVRQESALIPLLQHDIDRMTRSGYNVLKDEEVFSGLSA
jgi:hypothetical protein